MILNKGTQSLQVKLAGAKTANDCPIAASWQQPQNVPFFGTNAGFSFQGTTNGTTAVTVLSSPGGNNAATLQELTINNADTAAVTVTLQIVDSAGPTTTVVYSCSLNVGDTLEYVQGYGISVTDNTGALKQPASAYGQIPAKFTLNALAGAGTATAGDMTGAAYVSAQYSAVGAANLTTRTAAQLIADGGLTIGKGYVVEIVNTSGGTTTLVGGTGVTITGTATIATNTTRRFVVTATAAGAVTFQSVAVGTIS